MDKIMAVTAIAQIVTMLLLWRSQLVMGHRVKNHDLWLSLFIRKHRARAERRREVPKTPKMLRQYAVKEARGS